MEDPTSAAATLNPASPSSLGALLAEEWTINPYSTLPSFVERAMMFEASRSAYEFVGTALAAVERSLVHQLQQQQPHNLMRTDLPLERQPSDNDDASDARRLRWWQLLKALRRRLYARGCEWRRWAVTSAASVVRQYGLELQCLAVFVMERHSLAQYGGLVGETLYGAKRVKLGAPERSSDEGSSSASTVKRALEPLSHAEGTRLALLTAILPYLYEKSNQLARRRPHYAPLSSSSPDRTFTTAFFQEQCLPLLQTSLALVDLYCRWSYLMARSVHYDIVSLALQHVVRRVTEQDQVSSSSSNTPKAGSSDPPDIDRSDVSPDAKQGADVPALERGAQLARQSLLYMMVGTLAVSWLTQVRHAYVTYRRNRAMLEYQRHQQQSQRQHQHEQGRSMTADPAHFEEDPFDGPVSENAPTSIQLPWSDASEIPPPPPSVPIPNERGIPEGTCPLCRRSNRRKPTASSSGYVFCFACILDYVQRRRKCPITGSSCGEDDLIRLYEPDPALRSADNGL